MENITPSPSGTQQPQVAKWCVTKASLIAAIVMLVLSIAVIAVISYGYHKQSQLAIQRANTIDALTDTMRVFRNRDSSFRANIQAFEIDNKNLREFSVSLQRSNDSILSRLASVVGKYESELKHGGSVAVFGSTTTISGKSETVATPKDSIKSGGLVYVYPEYRSTFRKSKWASGDVIANKDSTQVRFKVNNEYDAVIGHEKQPWYSLKSPKPFVDVISHSPYDSVNKLRAMNVAWPKDAGIEISAHAGLGAMFGGGRITTGGYVGVGISKRILRIK